jgi:hypothetical protein
MGVVTTHTHHARTQQGTQVHRNREVIRLVNIPAILKTMTQFLCPEELNLLSVASLSVAMVKECLCRPGGSFFKFITVLSWPYGLSCHGLGLGTEPRKCVLVLCNFFSSHFLQPNVICDVAECGGFAFGHHSNRTV